jgi:hypothetical protein
VILILRPCVETSSEKPDISFDLEFGRKDLCSGSIDPLGGEVRAHMPEITNKSEEQKVAEAEVDSFRKDLGPFVVAA